MNDDDLPPECRESDRQRIQQQQIPLTVPDERDAPPPPRKPRDRERPAEPFLRS